MTASDLAGDSPAETVWSVGSGAFAYESVVAPHEEVAQEEFQQFQAGLGSPSLASTQPADVVVSGFDATGDGTVRVTYSVFREGLSALSLQVFRSIDGVMPMGPALMAQSLSGSAAAAGAGRVAVFSADFGGAVLEDERLIAVLKPSVDDPDAPNTRAVFAGGAIKEASGRLYVLGTEGDDTFRISRSGGNIVGTGVGSIPTAGITKIEARTYGGNDRVIADATVTLALNANAGLGNDIVAGGAANDILHGGAGHDILLGGGGTANTLDWGNDSGQRDTIVVTTLLDEDELATGVIGLDFGVYDVSLREAIKLASLWSGPDTIVFAPHVIGEIDLLHGQLAIRSDVAIHGPGASRLAIDAQKASRALLVYDDRPTLAQVSIAGLTIKNGKIVGDSGGGIASFEALSISNVTFLGNESLSGGGLFSQAGSVTVVDSTFTGNSAYWGGGAFLQTPAPAKVVGCTFSANQAIVGTYDGSGTGGGLYLKHGLSTQPYQVTNSTFSGNQAANSAGAIATEGAHSRLVHNTLASNWTTGSAGVGGLLVMGGGVSVFNTILADNIRGPIQQSNLHDLGAVPVSGSGNLFGTDGPGNPSIGTKLGAGQSAQLSALGDYGGATKTRTPLVGSLAIDRGNATAASAYGADRDQRGFTRYDDPTVAGTSLIDIGATERRVELTVTTLADADVPSGAMSLRQALNVAEMLPGTDAIDFATGTTGVVQLVQGQLLLNSPVTINGPRADLLTIDARNASGVVAVIAGVAATLRGVTLTGGNAYDGGGIFNWGHLTLDHAVVRGNRAAHLGGGIVSRSPDGGTGSLTLQSTTIDDNLSLFIGGGVRVDGQSSRLRIEGSTISNNRAYNGDSYTEAGGLHLALGAAGSARIISSTFSGNSAMYGGAIRVGNSAAPVDIISTTIANNTAVAAGGLNIVASGATVSLLNSIVATNVATLSLATRDVDGELNSASSYNMLGAGAGTTNLSAANLHNLIGTLAAPVDPLLSALRVHGGPTATHALLPGSDAIDAGFWSDTALIDQRGFARASAPGTTGPPLPDRGAFEYGAVSAQLGSELIVNGVIDARRDFGLGDQTMPSIAAAADGRTVVVWADSSAPYGVNLMARVLDKAGGAQGPVIPIAQYGVGQLSSATLHPHVSANANGRFAVVWQEPINGEYHVRARTFEVTDDGSLTFISSQPIAVTTPGTNSLQATTPQGAVGEGGEFVVSWHSSQAAGLLSRIFNSGDAPLTTATTVSSVANGPAQPSTVAAHANGFTFLWSDATAALRTRSVTVSPTGASVWGDSELVAAGPTGLAHKPALVVASGRQQVVWLESTPGSSLKFWRANWNEGGASWEVPQLLAERRPAPGYPEGFDAYIEASRLSIAGDDQGRLAIAWDETHLYDAGGWMVGYARHSRVQFFDDAGKPLGGPLPAKLRDSSDERAFGVALSATGEGRWVLAWQNRGEPTGLANIHVQSMHLDATLSKPSAVVPRLLPVSDVVVVQGGDPVNFHVTASYAAGDLSRVEIIHGDPAPGGVTVAMHPLIKGRAAVEWDHSQAAPGDYTLYLKVVDLADRTRSSVLAVRLRLVEPRPPLTFPPPSPKIAIAGEEFVHTVHAIDSATDGLGLQYSLVGNSPAGATINRQTGAIRWTPGAGEEGDHVLEALVVDLEVPERQASTMVPVTVRRANAAPEINGPPGLQMLSDSVLALGGAFAVNVDDAGQLAANAELEVRILAEHGRVQLASTAGLTFINGGAGQHLTLQFRGTSAAINVALDGMAFEPDFGYFGTATLQVRVNDLGDGGTQRPLTAALEIPITVLPSGEPLGPGAGYYSLSHNGLRTGNLLLDSQIQRFGGALQTMPLLRLVSVVDAALATVQVTDSAPTQITTGAGAMLTVWSDGSFVYDPSTIPVSSYSNITFLRDAVAYTVTDDLTPIIAPAVLTFDVVPAYSVPLDALRIDSLGLINDTGGAAYDRRTTDPRIKGRIVESVSAADYFLLDFDVDAADHFDAIESFATTTPPLLPLATPLVVSRSEVRFPEFDFDPRISSSFDALTPGRRVLGYRVTAMRGSTVLAVGQWHSFEFQISEPPNTGQLRFETPPRQETSHGIRNVPHVGPLAEDEVEQYASGVDPTIVGEVHGAFPMDGAAIVFNLGSVEHTLIIHAPGDFEFDPRSLLQSVGLSGTFGVNYELRSRSQSGTLGPVVETGTFNLNFNPTPPVLAAVATITAAHPAGTIAAYLVRGTATFSTPPSAVGSQALSIEIDVAQGNLGFDEEPDHEATAYRDDKTGQYAFESVVAGLVGPNVLLKARAAAWDPLTFSYAYGAWSDPFVVPQSAASLAPAIDSTASGERHFRFLEVAPGVAPMIAGYLVPGSTGDIASVRYARVEIFFQPNEPTVGAAPSGVAVSDANGRFEYQLRTQDIIGANGKAWARAVLGDGISSTRVEGVPAWINVPSNPYEGPALPELTSAALRLANELDATFDNATGRWTTSDPRVVGRLGGGDVPLSNVRIEIDYKGTSAVDAVVRPDAEGLFSFAAYDLPPGNATVKARVSYFDLYLQAWAHSDAWAQLQLEVEQVADAPVTVHELGLAIVDSGEVSPPITYDPTITGRVDHPAGLTQFVPVSVYRVVGETTVLLGATTTDANGRFTFTPIGISPGVVKLRAQAQQWSSTQTVEVEVEGYDDPWRVGQYVPGAMSSVLEFVLRAAAPLSVTGINLHSDTGAAGDNITANPLVIGALSGDGGIAGRRVEFNYGDGSGNYSDSAVHATATTDSAGRFRHLPTGLLQGSPYDIRARAAVWNAATGVFVPSGPWKQLHFVLTAPIGQAPAFQNGVTLANPTESATTPISQVRFTGRVRSEGAIAGIAIEFDYDPNDADEFDESTTTDEYGDFSFIPARLVDGPQTVRARIRETDASGAIRRSGWAAVPAFTYQSSVNAPPQIETLTATSSFAPTRGVRLLGEVSNANGFEGLTAEIHAAGGAVVGTAAVNMITGKFELVVPGLVANHTYHYFARVRESLPGGTYQYSDPEEVTHTYAPAVSGLRIASLAVVDTDLGGQGTSNDGVTASLQLNGAITGSGSSAGVTVTLQLRTPDGEWAESVTTNTTNASGSFSYSFASLVTQPGFYRVRARVASSAWQYVNFVYDPDDDSSIALATARAFREMDPNWQTSQTFEGELEQDPEEQHSSAGDQADAEHDHEVSRARAARDAARKQAETAFAAARSAAEIAYEASVHNAQDQFVAALAGSTLTSDQKRSYDLEDFIWPEAPDAYELALPPNSSQPRPPAERPTYDGPLPDFAHNVTYRQKVQGAEQDYQSALETAQAELNDSLTTIDDQYESGVAAAHATHRDSVAEAYATYYASRSDAPEFDDEQERLGHLADIREAWNEYNAAILQIDREKTALLNDIADKEINSLDDTYEAEEAEFLEAAEDYNESDQDTADEIAWKEEIFRIDQEYAGKYERILNSASKAAAAANREAAERKAAALHTAQSIVFQAQAQLALIARNRQDIQHDSRIDAELVLADALALAAKVLAIELADAVLVRDAAIADAHFSKDDKEAVAARDRTLALSEIERTAIELWSNAQNSLWGDYQSRLAGNAYDYRQAVAQHAYDFDRDQAMAIRDERQEVATAVKSRAVKAANAEELRRRAFAEEAKEFRMQVADADKVRDIALIGHWHARRMDFADAEQSYAFQSAEVAYDHALAYQSAYYAYETATGDHHAEHGAAHQWSAGWAYFASVSDEGVVVWTLDNDEELAQLSYEFELRRAEADRDRTIGDADAVRARHTAWFDAVEDYRTSSNRSHHDYAVATSGYYATYQIEVAAAQNTFNISVVTAAAELAVETTSAEAKRRLVVAQAAGKFDNAEAPLAGAWSVSDATAKGEYEFLEADAYFSAVATWASADPTPWRQYQRAIALAERKRVGGAGQYGAEPGSSAADIARAESLAAINVPWTSGIVAADLRYAAAMYGEGGALVERAQAIADAHVANAAADPLLTYVTSRAEAVKVHDVAVAGHSLIFFNALAAADATQGRDLIEAHYEYDVDYAQLNFALQKPNPITQQEHAETDFVNRQQRDVAVARAQADRLVTAAVARQAWTAGLGAAHVVLVEQLVAAEVEWATILAAEIVTLATGVAEGERNFLIDEADAIGAQTRAVLAADGAHSVAAAEIDATHAVAVGAVASTHAATIVAALGNFEVSSYANHATTMTTLFGYWSHPAAVARADREWHSARRALRNAHQTALSEIEAAYTVSINEANVAHAARTAALNEQFGSGQTWLDATLSERLASADAALYVARESARANLIVDTVPLRGAIDILEAKAAERRDNAIAEAQVVWVRAEAEILVDFTAAQADLPEFAERREAANAARTAAIVAADQAYADALKDARALLVEDQGALRIAYVTTVGHAAVDFASETTSAQNDHAVDSGELDVRLTQELASAGLNRTERLLAAGRRQTDGRTAGDVDFAVALIAPSVTRAGAIAESEAVLHGNNAYDAAETAANVASSAPSNDAYQVAAATAAARSAWADTLITPFINYRRSMAASDATLAADLAAARRTRDLEREAGTARHDQAAAGFAASRDVDVATLETQAAARALAATGVLTVSAAVHQRDFDIQVATATAKADTLQSAAERESLPEPGPQALQESLAQANIIWQARSATAEYDHALEQAAIETARVTQRSEAERKHAVRSAGAAYDRDLAFALAEAAYIVVEAEADNARRQDAALAQADLLGEHYAARAASLSYLVQGLDDLPWALAEQAQAEAQSAAWDSVGYSGVRGEYLSWQQDVGDAEADYAAQRASALTASRARSAAAVRSHAQELALATGQQVGAAATAQNDFTVKVAVAALEYRRAWALADPETLEGLEARDAARDEYDAAYAAADRARRLELARTSYEFVAGAGDAFVEQTEELLAAQSQYDASVRSAWYDSPGGDSLEATLAELARVYDQVEAAALATAAENLAAATSGSSHAPWTQLAAAEAQARRTYISEPLAELARYQRAGDALGSYAGPNLAAAETAYRAALAAAGRNRTLAEAQREARQSSLQAAEQLAQAGATSVEEFEPGAAPASIEPAGLAIPAVPSVGGFYGDVLPWHAWGAGYDPYYAQDYWFWNYGDYDKGHLWQLWAYGESDWTGGGGIVGMPAVDGAHGWAGPHGDWSLAGSFGGYAGWDGAWGLHSYGGSSWGLWHTGYVGLPGAYGADHTVDIEGALSGYRQTVAAIVAKTAPVIAALTNIDEAARLVINAATGAVIAAGAAVISEAEAARIQRFITSRSTLTWSGAEIRVLIGANDPAALDFFDRHFTLVPSARQTWSWFHGPQPSGEPYIEIHQGEHGSILSTLVDAQYDPQVKFHLEIPEGWNDFQVASYIFESLNGTANKDVARLFERYAINGLAGDAALDAGAIRDRWQKEHTLAGLKEAAETAGEYYKTLASVVPGGAAAVAVHHVQKAEYTSALLEVVFMGPVLGAIGHAAGKGGAVSLNVAGRVLANIPTSALQQIKRLPAAKQAELLKLIRNADDPLSDALQFLNRAGINAHGGGALTQEAVEAIVKRSDLFDGVRAHLNTLSASARHALRKNSKWIGDHGEEIAVRLLKEAGYTDLLVLKNASNHGVDVIAKLGDGRYAVFEVKATLDSVAKGLSRSQVNEGVVAWTRDRARRAAFNERYYRNIDDKLQGEARQLLNDIGRNPDNVSGNLIKINLSSGQVDVSPWP